ncbi:hypothetical protein [Gordonia rubripertincta]|uniref:hypothetical protein n=1 Tax=Gordonia rubripertincta TaxID=36822 RepID=UPI0015F94D57|nr:hypothetical protein [Gordonia rubripertincta]QMU19369.1 hypothetical protein H3V45_14855 [Gordonia rubripertincta]
MSGRLTGVYQLPDGSFPPRNSKLWIRVPVDRNNNGVTVYSAPTVVPINPPTHPTAPGFYDSGLLPEGPYQIQKAIFGATDYRTRWYSVVLGEGSHTVQELIEDYDPEQYTPPVINQVAVYRDEARTARDEAAQILDDVSAGAVPDSAVASKITAEGSASRAAVDARVAAGTEGLLSQDDAAAAFAAKSVETTVAAKYTKPGSGIPLSDLKKADLDSTYVRSVNGTPVGPDGNVVVPTGEVSDEVIADAVTTELAGRDLIEGTDTRIPQVMTTEDDWLEVHTDADGKVLYGVRSDGTFEDFRDVLTTDTLDAEITDRDLIDGADARVPEVISWTTEEWLHVVTDADDKIIFGIRADGTVFPEPVATTPYTPPIPITSAWPAVLRGDSTSATTNVAAGEGWGPKLAALSGKAIDNYGSSGQRAEEIAAQMGGITFTATVTGNTIPTSGAVALTNLEVNPVRGGEIASYTVKIAGVVGTLARGANDSTVNFTRTTAGSAVTVPAIVDVESVSGPALNHRIHFIAFGVNNEPLITAGSPTQRVEDIMAMYKACTSVLTPARPRFVVWGMLDRGASEGVDTTIGTIIRKVEDYLLLEYGSDFVPIRKLLASYRALAIAGVTPTSTDDADIAAGAIPQSLRDASSVHLNATGMTVQAHFMYQHLLRKGWI